MMPSNPADFSERPLVRDGSGLKPLTVSIKKARELLDVGNTTVWQLIKHGHVRTISIGRRRLVIYRSLEDLILAIEKSPRFLRADKEPLVGPDNSVGS